MVFSNKVVNILLILHLSAKKEPCRSKALFVCFSLRFKFDLSFCLVCKNGLQEVQKNEITNKEGCHVANIVGDDQKPLGSVGRQSPEEDIIIEAREKLDARGNECGKEA